MKNFPYNWTLKDANFTKDKGNVFSCFSCGGGSTMGYKLAGFNVIGCNEIDPKMMAVYKANHKPQFSFLESITTFKDRKDLPKELFNLEILDGSPPCSSFSMAGNREKDWGKKKKFREGQASQVLDTLFFDFIDLAERLQPKVVIAENVKGMLMGKAKKYVREIHKAFDKAGYYCQHFLLNASKMGVPQRRERVFFVCLRKDLAQPFLVQKDMFMTVPAIDLVFDGAEIPFGVIEDKGAKRNTLNEFYSNLMRELRKGEPDLRYPSKRLTGKPNNFGNKIQYSNKVCYSILASDKDIVYAQNRYKTNTEFIKAGTYPSDYEFNEVKPAYLIGMSVPPVMTAQIATRIHEQWLNKIPHQSQAFAEG